MNEEKNEENKYQICNLQLGRNGSKILKIRIPKNRLISRPNTENVIATLLDEKNNDNIAYHLLKKQPKQHSNDEQYIEMQFNFPRSLVKFPKKTNNDIEIPGLFLNDGFYNNNHKYKPNVVANDLIAYQNQALDNIIKDYQKYQNGVIKDGVKHCTINLCNHGEEDRMYRFQQDDGTTSFIRYALYIPFNDKNFNKLTSFYIHNDSCHGAYYDANVNTLFKELQEKIKNIKNPPKCFIRCVKPQYEETNTCVYDDKFNIVGIKSLPCTNGVLDLEDLEENKDKYFDYYYVEKDKIYKIPHELVKNRVSLINSEDKNNDFESKFKKYFNEGKIILVDEKTEFKEFYEKKAKNEEKKNQIIDNNSITENNLTKKEQIGNCKNNNFK